MTRLHLVPVLILLVAASACRPGRPIVGAEERPDTGGTIAGTVRTVANTPLSGRTVTAVDTKTGERYDTTTGVNGGYTIQVPQGLYRLEVQLQQGETLATRPPDTQVNRSDLDPGRDFVVTAAAAGVKP